MKRVVSTLAKGFVFERRVEAMKGIVKPAEELTFNNQVKLVKRFCYLGDRLNGSEAVVTASSKSG